MVGLTNLRKEKFFPKFANLPAEDDIDLRYYKFVNDSHLEPKQHWCLLAEIVSIENFSRLVLRSRDRAQMKVGYTIAILVKVFPSTLDNLLKLNDEVHLWKAFPNKGVCHACNKELVPLQKCARCGMVSYCDQECQKSGWEKMNHKKNCKILRDNDFQGMLKVKWEPLIERSEVSLDIGPMP